MKLHPVISTRHSRRRSGFTLLELVLAMLLLALLCGMIFSTANTNLALSNGVVKRQSEESLKNAFFQLMSRQLSGLPGNTRMKLTWSESSGPYLSDLTLQNAPMDFTWGGQEKSAKAVQISTVQKHGGFLDIVLKYYENEIIQDSDNPNDVADPQPFAQVTLLEDVRMFEWNVMDGRTLDWQTDWDLTGRLPLKMELKVAFGNNPEVIRQIFWITPKSDPETMMRQVAQQARQNPEAGGGGGAGGGGRPPGGGGGPGGPGGPGQGGPGRGQGGGGGRGPGGGGRGGQGGGGGGGGGFNGNGGGGRPRGGGGGGR